MDRGLQVKTPESVAFSYDLGGLGSRFLAVLLDMLIQVAILIAIVAGLGLAAPHLRANHAAGTAIRVSSSIETAFLSLLIFVVFFAYFIAFEAFWNGQTPGKRLLGLRVVRDAGYPLDFTAAAVRNLVRVAEVALGFYAVSAIATILSTENKRLGDFAAGTIVVRDARAAPVAAVVADWERAPAMPMLSPQEREIVDRFMLRRKALAPHARMEMAMRIADRIRPRLSADLARLDDETLLETLNGF